MLFVAANFKNLSVLRIFAVQIDLFSGEAKYAIRTTHYESLFTSYAS